MSWNFMDPGSRANIDRVWRRESEQMLAMAADPDVWQAPTGAGHWQVRDVIGHLVDTTEAYFPAFEAARGNGTVPDALGLPDMHTYVDEGARALGRAVPQAQLLDRLRAAREKMLGIAADLTDQEWAGLMVPHKYMGPIPAAFFPIFQVVDYAVHSWDIREGSGRNHGLDGDAADLLVPLCLGLWTFTCDLTDVEPFTVGIRITSGANAGDNQAAVAGDALMITAGDVSSLSDSIEFDPASFVLTAYGRINGGTYRGDRKVLDRFCNLFFRI